MKAVILILILLFGVRIDGQDFSYYRNMIINAEKSSSASGAFFKAVSEKYDQTRKPLFLALTGVAHFLEAKHSDNPGVKIIKLNKGQRLIERAVDMDRNSVEVRFLRYISQLKMPRISGYRAHLEEDEKFLRLNYNRSKDPALIAEIRKILKY